MVNDHILSQTVVARKIMTVSPLKNGSLPERTQLEGYFSFNLKLEMPMVFLPLKAQNEFIDFPSYLVDV